MKAEVQRASGVIDKIADGLEVGYLLMQAKAGRIIDARSIQVETEVGFETKWKVFMIPDGSKSGSFEPEQYLISQSVYAKFLEELQKLVI